MEELGELGGDEGEGIHAKSSGLGWVGGEVKKKGWIFTPCRGKKKGFHLVD